MTFHLRFNFHNSEKRDFCVLCKELLHMCSLRRVFNPRFQVWGSGLSHCYLEAICTIDIDRYKKITVITIKLFEKLRALYIYIYIYIYINHLFPHYLEPHHPPQRKKHFRVKLYRQIDLYTKRENYWWVSYQPANFPVEESWPANLWKDLKVDSTLKI